MQKMKQREYFQYVFLFIKKALYEAITSGPQLSFNIFL